MWLSITLFWSLILVLATPTSIEKVRRIAYGDIEYNTTFDVDAVYLGIYKGRKTGYLSLKDDGTGEYKYDIFGFAPASCERKAIKFIWGFILDKENRIVKNKRHYGISYPILLQSTGSNSFQGCRTLVLKDFILDRGNSLHISSSDDWQKTK